MITLLWTTDTYNWTAVMPKEPGWYWTKRIIPASPELIGGYTQGPSTVYELREVKEENMIYDFCEECGKTYPLNELSAMGLRCIECDPQALKEEGPVFEENNKNGRAKTNSSSTTEQEGVREDTASSSK